MRTTLKGRRFDLLVIGGGITGSGVARDAAMRGLEVALVEMDDFASGTSSRSSRLVHGGIRYLEHAQFGMVRESVRERETLLRIAPHLVHPLAFTWPVYRGARISRGKLRLALGIYDFLARKGRGRRHRMRSAEGVLEDEPSLSAARLLGGASYHDASTDDSRLTLANVLSAGASGAATLNHAEALRPMSRDKQEWVIDIRDTLTDAEFETRARVVVNATGPWRLNLERRWPQGTPQRRGTKGVHIAVPAERIGNRRAVTMISPDDGRVTFVLPGGGNQTIIGTTDSWTDDLPEEVRATDSDVQYLLRAANAYFPDARLGESDVVSGWAGIRPLADWDGMKNPSAVSREHRILRNGAGLITVTGGKLTTYRAVAAEIVDAVEHELGRKPSRCTTADNELPGRDRGREVAAIIDAEPGLGAKVVPELPYTMGDLSYAITNEMALTLSDLLMRRTRIAFETTDHGVGAAERVVNAVGDIAGWSETKKRAQIAEYAGDAARVFTIEASSPSYP
jgi:glycerol-3-phosphate dehydrogenase